jgi:hypothetical protein
MQDPESYFVSLFLFISQNCYIIYYAFTIIFISVLIPTRNNEQMTQI